MKQSENGRDEIVKYLLSLGADVNIKNKYGSTALHLATNIRKIKNKKSI